MDHKQTVCSILQSDEKILLMKRGSSAPWYADKWNFACGLIEEEETPEQTACREIREETGIEKGDLELEEEGKLIIDEDKEIGITWHIHPFLFKTKSTQIHLDHENQKYKWIKPKNLLNYPLAHGILQTAIQLLNFTPKRKGILAIVYKDLDSFIVVKTKNDNLSFMAGGVDQGETEEESVIREVWEESGLKVNKSQLKKLPFVNEFTYQKGFLRGVHSEQQVYLVKTNQTNLNPRESNIQTIWMSKEEVKNNLTFPPVKQIFEKSLKYIED